MFASCIFADNFVPAIAQKLKLVLVLFHDDTNKANIMNIYNTIQPCIIDHMCG